MKFVEDQQTLGWFENWTEGPLFDWDSGNIGKNKKHGLADIEIEHMFHHPILFVGKIVEPVNAESRWLVLGKVKSKVRACVFTRRDSKLRVISCRVARENERTLYE